MLEHVHKKFHSADGNELKIPGTAKMILSFKDLYILFCVFVGGVKCNLLGQDFMRKFQCNWDYCEKILVLNYDLFNQRGEFNDKILRVLTVMDCVIPVRHEALIETSILCTENLVDGILVSIKQFMHDYAIVIAHAIVNANPRKC